MKMWSMEDALGKLFCGLCDGGYIIAKLAELYHTEGDWCALHTVINTLHVQASVPRL